MRVLFAGGGTAGHVNPALAIAKYIRQRKPGTNIAFVGTREGIERSLIPKEGFPIFYIDVRGFRRRLCWYNVGAAKRAVSSLFEAGELLKDFRPDVVVGTGGYVSWPVLYMAAKRKIPTLIHEQNACPGITSRLLGRKVDQILISFEESRKYFSKKKPVILTGNPIREEMLLQKKQAAREKLGLDERPFVVSFAGSLGAREINRVMIRLIEHIKDAKNIRLLHATGERGWKWVPKRLKEAGIELEKYPHIQVVPYIYNMPDAMAAADLLICRAGAITLSEIAAMNKASVLIPSPNVTNNHQFHNAVTFGDRGAAIVIEEKELTAERLYEIVEKLCADGGKRRRMERAAANLAIYDSTEKIYGAICHAIEK
jgi:UDP-N-acetylglucosamine--N-acetylmuramyl-(pentapeptide) pyrophosphoryl-undecaprenol N-acetylglucosamine transferase